MKPNGGIIIPVVNEIANKLIILTTKRFLLIFLNLKTLANLLFKNLLFENLLFCKNSTKYDLINNETDKYK